MDPYVWKPIYGSEAYLFASVSFPTPRRWWSWRRWVGSERGPVIRWTFYPDGDGSWCLPT